MLLGPRIYPIKVQYLGSPAGATSAQAWYWNDSGAADTVNLQIICAKLGS